MRQIGIIGGGASGMMAAIAAANTSIKDTEITILERRDRIGRKILATGNGKCNLGNTDFSPKRDYRSHDPYRLPEFFARFQKMCIRDRNTRSVLVVTVSSKSWK